MANYTLTSEKKARMKKDVLEEIDRQTKNKKPASKAVQSPAAEVTNRVKPQLPKSSPVKKTSPQKTVPVSSALNSDTNIDSSKKEIKPKKVVKKTKPPVVVKKKVAKKKAIAKPKVISKLKPHPKKKAIVKTLKVKKTRKASKPIISLDLGSRGLKPAQPLKDKIVIPMGSKSITKKPPVLRLEGPSSSGKGLMFALGIVAFIVLAIIAFIAINIFGLYKLDWDSKTSYWTASTFDLSAGSVNGEKIAMTSYLDDVKVIKMMSELSADNSKYGDEAFDRLVSLAIVRQELDKYGQSISDATLDMEMEKVLADFDSIDAAKDEIQIKYNMSIESFRERVLKPILEIDLLKSISAQDPDLQTNQSIEDRANQALRIALAGGDQVDFNELSRQFSNNPNVIDTKGVMGWFVRGNLPQDIENELFSLGSGQVYDRVVRDDLGYHIFKVDAKIFDEDTETESIKLSQITIQSDSELYFKGLFDKAEIKNYLK
jgi:hypothetical protein